LIDPNFATHSKDLPGHHFDKEDGIARRELLGV
jgi:hypothetical protein